VSPAIFMRPPVVVAPPEITPWLLGVVLVALAIGVATFALLELLSGARPAWWGRREERRQRRDWEGFMERIRTRIGETTDDVRFARRMVDSGFYLLEARSGASLWTAGGSLLSPGEVLDLPAHIFESVIRFRFHLLAVKDSTKGTWHVLATRERSIASALEASFGLPILGSFWWPGHPGAVTVTTYRPEVET